MGGAAPDAGGQQGAADAATEAGTPEEQKPRKTLAELLKEDPEYKREYDEAMQGHIQRRLRGAKAKEERLAEAEKRLARYDGLLPYLAQNYGVAEDDLDGVEKAVKSDDKLFSRKAVENGTTGRAEREAFERELANRRQQAENARLRMEMQQQKEAADRERLFVRWDKEIPETAAKYPNFDFEREMQDPRFAELAVRVGVRDAYEQVHRAEIDAALVENARKEATSQVASSVAANMSRPAEGGLAKQSAPQVHIDPRTLTKEQRLDIRRRVKRGEKITFE